ncbi:MAG TPA: hypothetical protein VMD30_07080, partial [Tepidisphaeraceae bacterium]|nr:hypothetical protein [Tepidisphaeraceae bacterium]
MDPVFNMYSANYDSWAQAARQEWGSQGIYIPEIAWFDGLETLPASIAAEMRDLYLVRKPWSQRSAAFMTYAQTKSSFSSRWNWMLHDPRWVDGRWLSEDKGAGPFGHTTHILSTTAKIAWLYWLRYDYTRDENWLRTRAYPMLRGTVELYRNFPTLTKDADGTYHIHHVNDSEPVWDATDPMEEVAAMRGITPVLIRASEILNVDANMRPVWQDFLDHLPPLPTTADLPGYKPGQLVRWVSALPPVRKGKPGARSELPLLQYDLCTVGTADPRIVAMANATHDAPYNKSLEEEPDTRPDAPDNADIPHQPHRDLPPEDPITRESHVLSRAGLVAARLGRADEVKQILPRQLSCPDPAQDFCDYLGSGQAGVLPNRMDLREGPGDLNCERLGRVAEALNAALIQSVPPFPGGDPVIYLFPAWPKSWNASIRVLARGGFIVTAAIHQGTITQFQITSTVGGICRVHDPWPSAIVYRNGQRAETLSGGLIAFTTSPGEQIELKPG